MSQQDPWLGWGAAVIPVALAAAWGFIRRFLSFVTRSELAHILNEQDQSREKQRIELHKENIDNFRSLFDRLGKVEQSQARTEGMLSGRYPKL
jgi:hypothetical protein